MEAVLLEYETLVARIRSKRIDEETAKETRADVRKRFLELERECETRTSAVKDPKTFRTVVMADTGDYNLKAARRRYQIVNKEYRIAMAEIREDAQDQARKDLMGGGSGTAGTAGTAGTGQGRNRDRDRDLGGSANDARLQESKSTSRKTTVLLKRGLEDLKESDTIGSHALEVLEKDAVKIQVVSDHMNTIQSDLQISSRLVTRMAKALYTDKIVQLLVCLVILAVVAIVVFTHYKR